MASYNRVILMGNLTRDPELRYLPSNMPVVGIGLAVNDRYKDKQSGEWIDKPNFIDCEAFGRTAEVINQYFQKGRPIMIEGKLRYDQWEQNGQKRSKLKVVIDSFEFVGGRDDQNGGGGGGGGRAQGGYGGGGGRGGQQGGGGGYDAPPQDGGYQAVDDGDIPF